MGNPYKELLHILEWKCSPLWKSSPFRSHQRLLIRICGFWVWQHQSQWNYLDGPLPNMKQGETLSFCQRLASVTVVLLSLYTFGIDPEYRIPGSKGTCMFSFDAVSNIIIQKDPISFCWCCGYKMISHLTKKFVSFWLLVKLTPCGIFSIYLFVSVDYLSINCFSFSINLQEFYKYICVYV